MYTSIISTYYDRALIHTRYVHAPTAKVVRDFLYYFYVGPLFFESSILHHLMHFNVMMFPARYRAQVARSCFSGVCCVLFSIVLCFDLSPQKYKLTNKINVSFVQLC